MEKVACYIRVSTEEQKLHGISLDAQIDKLQSYADTHNLIITEWYKDEGVSGRKLISKRPELQRMLIDARAKKFDRIIFIKLDRFFRSVAEYHECMKFIEPVVWTATEEKYDLTTANGRAFVNMKLTIAELEADQTGERIKIVNDYKVKNSQAIQGAGSMPFGFTTKRIEGIPRVIKDPQVAEIVPEIIDYFLKYQNKTATCKWANIKYGLNLKVQKLDRMLSTSKLYGAYRDNLNYCEPYVDKATFDKIQAVLKRNVKQAPTGNTYLFTGLIVCPCCGQRLTIVTNGFTHSYRCYNGSVYKRCVFNHTRSEMKIERALLGKFNQYMKLHIEDVKVSNRKADTNNAGYAKRIAEIKQEMANSVKAFIKGRLTEAEHDREYAKLEDELKALESRLQPTQERDLTSYEALLKSGWINVYNALNQANKQAFWRTYIDKILIDENFTITGIIFLK